MRLSLQCAPVLPCGNGATAEPLRHRQTKGAATDMLNLKPPRHTPTLRRTAARGRNRPVDVGQLGASRLGMVIERNHAPATHVPQNWGCDTLRSRRRMKFGARD